MQQLTAEQLEDQLIEDIAGFTHDPYGYACYAFPWGEKETPLENESGPREWQKEVLNEIGDHLQNPETRHQPLQIARSSGHGIGKSALFGMVVDWAMDTCEDTRIIVTANTDGQLKSKTVPEVIKWRNMSITEHWFNSTATAIYSNQPKHDKSWRCDFLPWSKDNTEAFAGLHNKGKRIVILFDEASAIDDVIWEVIEGALTDEDTEIIWIAFGNPTRNTGRFRECWRQHSKDWSTKKIDSRTVPGTNKVKIKKWEESYGVDSDWFRVRVRGEFPNASASQFIPTELIERNRGSHLNSHQYDFAPVILTCDPAWWGDDDIVIGYRQGLHHRVLETFKKNNNDVVVANKLARYEDEHNADAVFIDMGYGTGIYSAGTTMGRSWQLVAFSSESGRKDCYNKRAEMLVSIKEWLEAGGVLDPDDELYEELIALETMPTMDGKFKFPPKADMKKVIGRSPNKLDQLGLTFAFPVVKKRSGNQGVVHEFDPMEV